MSTQSERLLKLAAFLETLPPERYDHGMYHCGTRGCALGWAAYAKDRIGFEDLALASDTTPIDPTRSRYDIAREYFGNNSPERIFITLRQPNHDRSVAGVIKAIRAYAAELAGVDSPTHEVCDPDFKEAMDALLARAGVSV